MVLMNDKQYDEMLQDMTLNVQMLYETATGKVLDTNETIAVKDLLDMFFNSKR